MIEKADDNYSAYSPLIATWNPQKWKSRLRIEGLRKNGLGNNTAAGAGRAGRAERNHPQPRQGGAIIAHIDADGDHGKTTRVDAMPRHRPEFFFLRPFRAVLY